MELGASGTTFFLDSTLKVISHYYALLSGAGNELDGLIHDLNEMKGFVKDNYAEHKNTAYFNEWVKSVRDVMLDVEDTIATYATQVAIEKNSNAFRRMLKLNTKVNQANKVKDLVEKVNKVFNPLKSTMNLRTPQNNSHGSIGLIPAETTHKILQSRKETKLIVFKETDELVADLTLDEHQVFAIAGMGGLGKTTLAWNIHRHEKIVMKYPDNIWVDVSQVFDINNVLKTIVAKLKDKDSSIKDSETTGTPEDLSKLVREKLEKGPSLLIFDDVWTREVWGEIQKFLPLKDNTECRVLITTRYNPLADYASAKTKNLNTLDNDKSWELLQLEVFGNLGICPPDLEKYGKEIAKNCGGLPFAIGVMGGVLHYKWKTARTKAGPEWELVSKRVKSYLYDDNIAATELVIESREKDSLTEIIALSYSILSDELKDCFLYLAMFPENTNIPVHKLTRLWIAERFIRQREGMSLEQTAQIYVKNLIDINLLMVAETKPNDEVKSCRMHDLTREFCKNKAVSFQEIRMSQEGKLVPGVDEMHEFRHICIHSSLMKFLEKKPKIRKVRSFLSFSQEKIVWDKSKQLPSITDTFDLVRVLDLHMPIKFSKFPSGLTQLLLLKYVTLSSDEFKVLPKAVYKLWNIETLEVYTSLPTLKIKANIWKMKQLRHFKTKASIILTKAHHTSGGAGASDEDGENLHTLNRLCPKSCKSKLFMSKARNLKVLGIRGDLGQLLLDDAKSDNSHCLEELQHLEKLKLVNGLSPVEAREKPMPGVPPVTWFPKILKILVLTGTYLAWNEHMPSLCKIPTLEVLKLKENAFVGERWNATATTFSCLESLHISGTDLEAWIGTGNAFPKLKVLVLKNCVQLKGVPNFTGLHLLHLHGDMDRLAVSSAKKLKEANNSLKLSLDKLLPFSQTP